MDITLNLIITQSIHKKMRIFLVIMQKKLNLKIKYREGFRPFAPAVLAEHAQEYFECSEPSPYMLFTAPVATHRRHALAPASAPLFERLYTPRSDLPAITHLDYSARIQTVSRDTNEPFWLLLQAFRKQARMSLFGFSFKRSANRQAALSSSIPASTSEMSRSFAPQKMRIAVS